MEAHEKEALRNVLLERLTRKLGTCEKLEKLHHATVEELVVEATELGLYPACCFDCRFIIKETIECHIPFYQPKHSLGTLDLEETKTMGTMCKMFRR